ncbi:hypothetical protein EDC01DRAFT_643422 [Geopyxis carbonaria]|nr:hypothetical protein EDC01DRAFT_643422 [Geopyxis carbonaria]
MAPAPPAKRRKTSTSSSSFSKPKNHHHHTATPSATSVNAHKKRIRDLTRLLARPGLTADARADAERALAAHSFELRGASRSKHEQATARRYHMVRFFERVKATRKVNKARRALAAVTAGETAAAAAETAAGEADEAMEEVAEGTPAERLHAAEVELNYALHYPKGEKYISLYKDPGADAAARREEIKADVARRMAAGTLGERTISDEGDDGEGREYGAASAKGVRPQAGNKAAVTKKRDVAGKGKVLEKKDVAEKVMAGKPVETRGVKRPNRAENRREMRKRKAEELVAASKAAADARIEDDEFFEF